MNVFLRILVRIVVTVSYSKDCLIKKNEFCFKMFFEKKSSFNPLFGYFSPSGLENFWIIMLAIFGQSLVPPGLNWPYFKGFFRFNIPKSFKNHIKIIQNYIKIIYKSNIIIIKILFDPQEWSSSDNFRPCTAYGGIILVPWLIRGDHNDPMAYKGD